MTGKALMLDSKLVDELKSREDISRSQIEDMLWHMTRWTKPKPKWTIRIHFINGQIMDLHNRFKNECSYTIQKIANGSDWLSFWEGKEHKVISIHRIKYFEVRDNG